MSDFSITSTGKKRGFVEGYTDNPNNASVNHLSSPSKNCYVDDTGEAKTRDGYGDTGWDLDEADNAAIPFYIKRWNVTFFSLYGKVKFVDHGNDNNVIDTGLALTATEKTTFGEYAGDVYCTNRTDGLRQIHMGRSNGASVAGAATITVDQDLAGRLNAFSDTAGTLRIATDTQLTEAYTGAAATGVITLTNTLDSAVPDNTIVYTVEDISSGKPKGSNLTFWKERMIIWGVVYDTAADSPTNIVYMSKFAVLASLENIIDFDTTGTAAKEMIGKGGEVTDILATRDYLYIFKESETYFSGVADVNLTTGGTLPQLLTSQHGCISAGCSVDLGNGKIAFVTPNKRIMGIGISTETGAAVVFPIENFDNSMSNTLKKMNSGQTTIKVTYHAGGKKALFQMRIDSAWITLVYDNEIENWQPPWTNYVFNGYFEIDGKLYATALNDDTVYVIGEEYKDDAGIDIETIMATGIFEFEEGRTTCLWKDLSVSGSLTRPTTITVEAKADQMATINKQITSDGLSFPTGNAIGLGTIGGETIGGDITGSGFARYDAKKGIYRYAGDIQFILSASGQGAAFTWRGFTIKAKSLSHSLLTLQ